MFKALFRKVILSSLSGYIQDFDKSQLKVKVWSGKIVLKNAALDPKLLLKHDLPLIFKYSKISKIKITIPWFSLNKKPIEISVQGLYCIIVPFHKYEWNFNIEILVEKLKEALKNHEMWWKFERAQRKLIGEANKQKSSYRDRLKEKMFSNVQISLTHMHVRFEDSYKKSEYSLGLVIDSISLDPKKNVNPYIGTHNNGNPKFRCLHKHSGPSL